MTICIAIRTTEGDIVGFADRLIGDDNISKNIEGQKFLKITQLNSRSVLMTSGDFTFWDEVIQEYKTIINKEFPFEYQYDRSMVYSLPKAIKLVKDAKLEASLDKEKFELNRCFAIIAGIDKEAYLFMINEKGEVSSYTAVGYASIGSGSNFADSYLWSGSFINQLSLEQALYEGYRSKKTAEQDQNVGKSTDMFVIHRFGNVDFSNQYLDILEKTYNKEMEQIDELHKNILKEYTTKLQKTNNE